MKTLKVKWTGIRPLIMSNPQTVDVENDYSLEARRLNSALKAARKKEDESMMIELSQKQKANDFRSSAYFDDKAKRFFVPDTTLLACIKEAAKSTKKGKDIDRCVMIEETHAYVDGVPVAKSLDAAYQNDAFRFCVPAKIPPRTGSLFYKMRCIMPTGWTLTFSITYDETMITEKAMRDILETAGKYIGVGGWRPKFGRFLVEII